MRLQYVTHRSCGGMIVAIQNVFASVDFHKFTTAIQLKQETCLHLYTSSVQTASRFLLLEVMIQLKQETCLVLYIIISFRKHRFQFL